ncbi:MAG TPA: flagellar motor switch protein FliM [Syntrophorhabdaceae bacterium]|nr:flagellar motor switch protein FliM [Syntrophorhabdaceae bacterium]
MEQILSLEEIDALLSGLSEGTIEPEPIKEPEPEVEKKEIKQFDILQWTKTKKENLPALQFIYDRFSKSFQSALSLFLERDVEIEYTPVQYMEYKEFIKSLPLPTNMNIIITEKLKGFFIVIFDTKVIFYVLEALFGSPSPSVPKIEGREFTRIELTVVKKLVEIVSTEMEKAWSPVYPIQCRYSRSEMNPNYVTLISQEETVSVNQFSFEMGNVTGWMKVCIPYGILESIKDFLISTPSREDLEMKQKWVEKMKEGVTQVPIELRAILGKKRMSLKDFMNIAVDSIIVVDRYVNDPVDILVGDKPKFKGKVGILKGNKAVQIEGPIH